MRQGAWLQIFPEGKVNTADPHGFLPFKWGVGKIVCDAATGTTPPLVLPFYHRYGAPLRPDHMCGSRPSLAGFLPSTLAHAHNTQLAQPPRVSLASKRVRVAAAAWSVSSR